MDKKTYEKHFGIKNNRSRPSAKHLRAFSQVSDIRKFEIEMYWKRAAYFWTIIAVTFAGYFSIFSAEGFKYKDIFSLLLSSMGMVFTFSWYLVNKGSKFWQENWENHLDLLEDSITGPLYKTVLHRPEIKNDPAVDHVDRVITGPGKFSASKINQWVAIYVLSVWGLLTTFSIYAILVDFDYILTHIVLFYIILGIPALSLTAMFFMWTHGDTHTDVHKAEVTSRQTEIC